MPVPKASRALSRFTVLDLTQVRSGPTCVRQLADWGANVIKIEQPPQLTSGGEGFVKFKGSPAEHKWMNAHIFSTPKHGDKNPESTVVFDKGVHTITIAPRSTGVRATSSWTRASSATSTVCSKGT